VETLISVVITALGIITLAISDAQTASGIIGGLRPIRMEDDFSRGKV
jgi:hypothetical protein